MERSTNPRPHSHTPNPPSIHTPMGHMESSGRNTPRHKILIITLIIATATALLTPTHITAQTPPPQTNPPYPPGDYEVGTTWDFCSDDTPYVPSFLLPSSSPRIGFSPCVISSSLSLLTTSGSLRLAYSPVGRLGVTEIYELSFDNGSVLYLDCLNAVGFAYSPDFRGVTQCWIAPTFNGDDVVLETASSLSTSCAESGITIGCVNLDLVSRFTLKVVDVVGQNVGCWYWHVQMSMCVSNPSTHEFIPVSVSPPTTSTTLPARPDNITDANRCWVLRPDLTGPPFGRDLDGDGECDRDEDGDGIVDFDFSDPGDVCSGLTERQCNLLDVEPEVEGEPCDAGYNGHYDAWFASILSESSQFQRWRHIGYDGSSVVLATHSIDNFIGVELRSIFAGTGADCVVVLEIWETQTGFEFDFRFSVFVPAVSDRVIPLLRDADIAYSVCWQGSPVACTGDISDATCDTDIEITLASGGYDVISCWGDISAFDWETYLNLLPIVGTPQITLLPSFSADQGYYIAQIVSDFWECFAADTTAGFPFLDEGPSVYDRYTGAYEFVSTGGGGGGFFGFIRVFLWSAVSWVPLRTL